ncbi:MAG: damage-inducible protein DinB [Armatimonadetes bacterium]|nr:damage-inducible protein DinB [Armatimonadota bacterium]
MTTGEMKELFAYGTWANGLVFEAASALAEEQLHHTVASSFPSVCCTLAHIVGAEWLWLRRWLGDSPGSFPDWMSRPVYGELRAQLSAVEHEREVFLAGLSDADLSQTVSYRTLGGQAFSDPLGILMKHVVNHSTYHRGQVVTQLRQLGQKPPSTDLILYLRQSK